MQSRWDEACAACSLLCDAMLGWAICAHAGAIIRAWWGLGASIAGFEFPALFCHCQCHVFQIVDQVRASLHCSQRFLMMKSNDSQS